jgi:hypothetical protein
MLTFDGPTPNGHTFAVSFSFKTTASDAIILVSSHSTVDDHIVVEVVGGKLRFNFGAGSDCLSGGQGASRNVVCDDGSAVTVEAAAAVNDNQWHIVRAARTGRQTSTLTVDGITVEGRGSGKNGAVNLDTPLYVGGHPDSSQVSIGLAAKTNFVGCLSDIYYEMEYDMPTQACGNGAKTYDGHSFDTYTSTRPDGSHVQGRLNPAHNLFTFSFSFKTTATDAIIFMAAEEQNTGDVMQANAVLLDHGAFGWL